MWILGYWTFIHDSINRLNHREVPDVNVDILENFYNAYRTPRSFLLRKISRFGIPKSTVLVIIFRVFIWPLLFINVGPRSLIRLQCFEMASQKRRDRMLQARWTMELLCHPLILQWHPRKIKIPVPRLKSKWKTLFIS